MCVTFCLVIHIPSNVSDSLLTWFCSVTHNAADFKRS